MDKSILQFLVFAISLVTIAVTVSASSTTSNFRIFYLGKMTVKNISIATSDGNVVSYPSLSSGQTLYSLNTIKLQKIGYTKSVDVVFAIDDFYPSFGAALCPKSNVLHTDLTWEFRIKRNDVLSEWQYVKNYNPNKGYCARGIPLGRINNGDVWEIELRGNIPSKCLGNWNLNDNSRYVFLINNYTCMIG
jgi:hypothetical protein